MAVNRAGPFFRAIHMQTKSSPLEASADLRTELMRPPSAPILPLPFVTHIVSPAALPDLAEDESSLQQKFVRLACSALKADHACYGLSTPNGHFIQAMANAETVGNVAHPGHRLL